MPKTGKFKFNFRLKELTLILLVVISGVMVSFSSGGFIINFRNVGFTVFSFIEKGVSSVSIYIQDGINNIKKIASLSKEYDSLKEKLKDYEYMQRTNSTVLKENKRLKELLGFSESIQQKNIPANIISRGADNINTTIIIDKGSRDGIKKNMSVLAIQNGNIGVVGKVISVSYFTSVIMPVYDINCMISARIQNTRDIGLISGNGSEDSPLSLKNIKKKVIGDLHFGDVIVTSGENGNYLKDVPIGTISKITVLEYDTSLDIEITPIIDFSRLEYIIVVSTKDLKDSVLSENTPKEGENK